jgi:hypothetical protein
MMKESCHAEIIVMMKESESLSVSTGRHATTDTTAARRWIHCSLCISLHHLCTEKQQHVKEEIEGWWKEWTHGMWLRPLQCED